MTARPQVPLHAIVLVLSVVIAAIATRWTLTARGAPEAPHRWPQVFLNRLLGGLQAGGRERYYWVGLLVYGAVVSGLHFGGLHFAVYDAIAQWDLFTHALSGAGVAAILSLTFRQQESRQPQWWILPAVLAIGTGFEIYEFVFKGFWHTWSWQFYLSDTVLDLVVNVLGAGVFVGLAALRNS
ncbi:hypothetical protein HTSR_0365 [Halodesulfurarchaeum formicicum]|uniref:Uncharacterized protein n=1 Tax=Halodesulfurarchaeum formicicum TaxID=1873524 RepID=A0A1D8S2I2_9EURY|nr:hypothetical protein [Halodesulfurarchaeum formicicum]AOW79565.1 hypothetical protein HTSR_0365 [Halodesulfurarchaeum formicicum]